MIRFIDLGKQIGADQTEWPREFAYFDTTIDLFIKVNEEHVWASWEEFKQSYQIAFPDGVPGTWYTLERFEGLCHQWAKEAVSPWI